MTSLLDFGPIALLHILVTKFEEAAAVRLKGDRVERHPREIRDGDCVESGEEGRCEAVRPKIQERQVKGSRNKGSGHVQSGDRVGGGR